MKDKRYDLSLGDWGPYNKEYYGVCHIADKKRGATFNVELFPGFFRRSVLAGNSKSDTGVKLWGANPELTRFCYRYELQWKDQIYCDVDFNITDDRQVDVEYTFVNNTEFNQSLDMTLAASLQLPVNMPGSEKEGFYTFYKPVLPEGVVCIDATEHTDINCLSTIAGDGKYLGEEEQNNTTGLGTAIDGYHFFDVSHYLKYDVNQTASCIGIRYNTNKPTSFIIKINGMEYTLELCGGDEYSYTTLSFDRTDVTELVIAPTGEHVSIDCICIGDDADKVTFEAIPHNLTPEKNTYDDHITLKYKDIPELYTVKWYEPVRHHRQCRCADIGKMLQLTVNDHVSGVVSGLGEGIYEVILSNPVYLGPGERHTGHFRIFKGEEIESVPRDIDHVKYNSDGERFAFSQDMMRYNTLLNVVYPIYTRRQYIKHNAPGRFWNSLYSWDSGFIGMGLACADFTRGYDCLNTYLTPVGDRHSPYIFHGSVVPTQIFLYKHLVDSFPDKKEELKALYPMMKQYYVYYAEMDKGSEQMASGLLKTWHMSYNSGGWDDYPPQDRLRHDSEHGGENTHNNTTPVITTANTVLISKIMKMISETFGYDEDISYYEATAEKYAARLPQLWDEEVGYFSYMVHDEKGMPKEFFRYDDGSNYNQGLDGITPYIADSCTEDQAERMLDNIKNGLMTDIGVCVVDKRAPYYSPYGYWNGSVWMPHQWILWKRLIDEGETELAFEIADKSLKVWAAEVDASYCCFENFMCHNGRGSGYHHFSGLSCPISLFFESYYTQGTITPGFSSVVTAKEWNSAKTQAKITASAEKQSNIIICMSDTGEYSFTVNGTEQTPVRLTKGAYSININKGKNEIVVR